MRGTTDGAPWRADLQGLRAVAVLLVVVYHSGIVSLPGGYVGVDVFFVISGYLITGLLRRELQRTGTIDLRAFYARRVRRLVPAATLVLTATLLIAWRLYGPLEFQGFAGSAIATAVYLSNLWFARQATDYLAEGPDGNPLLHTWSLSVEEQFYLVWPLLFVLVLHTGPRGGGDRRLRRAMLVLTAASLGACLWLTQHDQPWAFFTAWARGWEFAVGGMLALAPTAARRDRRRLAATLPAAGLSLIAVSALWLDGQTAFPGSTAMLPVLGSALVIGAGHHLAPAGAGRILAAAPLRFVGGLSYSLYLWHWPVFVFMAEMLDDVGTAERLAGIALSLLLAVGTRVAVEDPMRFGYKAMRRSGHALAFGLVVVATTSTLAVTLRSVASEALAGPTQQRYLAASDDLPKVYDNGCHADFAEVASGECSFGDADSAFTVVLFGDSHAAQWFPALEALATDNGWRLVSLTKSACPSFLFEPQNGSPNGAYIECGHWREFAFDRIAALRPQLTVIASSNRYRVADANGAAQRAEKMADGLERTLRRLRPVSDQIVVMHDTPELAFHAPSCLSLAAWRDDDVDRRCVLHQPQARDAVIRHLDRRLLRDDDIHLVDMTGVICPYGATCAVEADGLILYRDDNHLTASFARHLAGPLAERLHEAVAAQAPGPHAGRLALLER